MKKDLWGSLYNTEEDVVVPLLEELNNSAYVYIKPNIESRYGFTKSGKINKKGLYLIYKDDKLIYVGMSTGYIQTRISRFFAAARRTDRFDERHPAGEKYHKIYNNFDNISIKTVDFDFNSLPQKITVENVEEELIYRLKPLLNAKGNKSRFCANAVLRLKESI
jgi:hypothetical protein